MRCPPCARSVLTAALLPALAACGGGTSATIGAPPPPPPSTTPPPPAVGSVDVTTYHNDNARTGLNDRETALTPAKVNVSSFGKLGFVAVDGKVDAQPLVLSALSVNGATHNVLYVATEHDSVYAFDADSGQTLWRVSLLRAGETPSDNRGCGQVTPEIGITATPVIDRGAGPHGTIYLVAMSKDAGGAYHQRLHALDVTTGAGLDGGPTEIQASYPGTGDGGSGGRVIFDPGQYKERDALTLAGGVVYTAWASHCDQRPYTGWVIGYDAGTLQQASVLDITPNGNDAAFWNSGTGPAADDQGNLYQLAGNGTFETTLDANGFPSQQDYGNAFLKLSTGGGKLAVSDYFNMFNTVAESDVDEDLGSGGALVLPDLVDGSGSIRHLAVGAGKDQNIYVVDRDDMGKFDPNRNAIWQELPGALAGAEFGMPAYFNGTVYYGAVGDVLRAYSIRDAKLSNTPTSTTSTRFGYPGTTPGLSADGVNNGIVWAVENGPTAVLHAYDAGDLGKELYNSALAPADRDRVGSGNKFITPTIANGKVYVGTADGVAVFGLLP